MILRSFFLGHQKSINRPGDTQHLRRSFDMVCDELDAARQCPPGRQELNGLHCIPAMLLVHTGSELPFLVGERSPLVTFQFSSSFCAEMSALSMPDRQTGIAFLLAGCDCPRHCVRDRTAGR
jgi:hypothetical protein